MLERVHLTIPAAALLARLWYAGEGQDGLGLESHLPDAFQIEFIRVGKDGVVYIDLSRKTDA